MFSNQIKIPIIVAAFHTCSHYCDLTIINQCAKSIIYVGCNKTASSLNFDIGWCVVWPVIEWKCVISI